MKPKSMRQAGRKCNTDERKKGWHVGTWRRRGAGGKEIQIETDQSLWTSKRFFHFAV
jgi:hypothetical protein